ncbi:hypothetical protein PoB_006366200 [Plakobranchus ocellatus]|uniref:Uncharacterized protein n=1 Tax=Plakobranchus ocellatus TaxID=259542 RepID=A0AAV4CZ12_9GAST|nr:hypothetical protein PoB_006366200 [Plakobranchus ocellatus]
MASNRKEVEGAVAAISLAVSVETPVADAHHKPLSSKPSSKSCLPSGYAIVDLTVLASLFTTFCCSACVQATHKDHLSGIHKATDSAKKELMDKAEYKIQAAHNTPTASWISLSALTGAGRSGATPQYTESLL